MENKLAEALNNSLYALKHIKGFDITNLQETSKVILSDSIKYAIQALTAYEESQKEFDVVYIDEKERILTEVRPTKEDKEVPPGKHRYFPGNYSNTCAMCKKEFYWAGKLCFICEDCCDEKAKTEILMSYMGNPTKEESPVSEVGRLQAIIDEFKGKNKYYYVNKCHELDAEILSLKLSNSKLVDALKELVDVKELKDNGGHTPEYLNRMPLAWMAARKALSSITEDKTEGI